MRYNAAFFDHPIDRRGTDCEKWDSLNLYESREMLPLWIADMDFRCPEEITNELINRGKHPVYGYTTQTERYSEALLSYIARRHGIRLEAHQHYTLPCVITGLCAAVQALTDPGDQIIIQPPVYGPFFHSIKRNRRIIKENPLLRDDLNRYTMDYEGLERICSEGAKLMILCSPHNPVGRCWSPDELSKLVSILFKHGVYLISDEIHWDFVYEPHVFTSVLTLPEAQSETAPIAVITSASKTFNLAGLLQATLLTRNPVMMNTLTDTMQSAGVTQGNIFSLIATEIAYRKCDTWLDALLLYLNDSRQIVQEEVKNRLPKAILSPIEATYLAWLDLSAYGFSNEELMRRTHAQRLALTDGTIYGPSIGEGFLRISMPCPHDQLREALTRLEISLIR